MTAQSVARGQPLWVFLGLTMVWTAGRALLWQAPAFEAAQGPGQRLAHDWGLAAAPALLPAPLPPAPLPLAGLVTAGPLCLAVIPGGQVVAMMAPPAYGAAYGAAYGGALAPLAAGGCAPAVARLADGGGTGRGRAGGGASAAEPFAYAGDEGYRLAPAAHARAPEAQLAGGSALEAEVLARAGAGMVMLSGGADAPPAAQPAASAPAPAARPRRFGGDAWLLWRPGGTFNGASAPMATYGASQVGSVLRYRLAPDSAPSLALYLRGTAALNGSLERDMAAGLQLRPIAGLPLLAMAEVRNSLFYDGTVHVRPAGMVVAQPRQASLPLGFKSTLYVQGGYVGGAAATPFVDGQWKVEHPFDAFGKGNLRLGGGLWGGAQTGAGRLDVGPSVSIGAHRGRLGLRLGADWRMRVAGHAAPGNGPAVTLFGGF
ncbi:MAG TPA: hypothetical protein VFF98_14445 [Novosphingobium sp.]|nr:hypothetical protein [Novosphingobium sp.]